MMVIMVSKHEFVFGIGKTVVRYMNHDSSFMVMLIFVQSRERAKLYFS